LIPIRKEWIIKIPKEEVESTKEYVRALEIGQTNIEYNIKLEKASFSFNNSNIDDMYKFFTIKRNSGQTIFSFYSRIYVTYFIFNFIEHTYIRTGMEQKGLIIGMGKVERNALSTSLI